MAPNPTERKVKKALETSPATLPATSVRPIVDDRPARGGPEVGDRVRLRPPCGRPFLPVALQDEQGIADTYRRAEDGGNIQYKKDRTTTCPMRTATPSAMRLATTATAMGEERRHETPKDHFEEHERGDHDADPFAP